MPQWGKGVGVPQWGRGGGSGEGVPQGGPHVFFCLLLWSNSKYSNNIMCQHIKLNNICHINHNKLPFLKLFIIPW